MFKTQFGSSIQTQTFFCFETSVVWAVATIDSPNCGSFCWRNKSSFQYAKSLAHLINTHSLKLFSILESIRLMHKPSLKN